MRKKLTAKQRRWANSHCIRISAEHWKKLRLLQDAISTETRDFVPVFSVLENLIDKAAAERKETNDPTN